MRISDWSSDVALPISELGHGETARVDLPVRPLQVANGRLLGPAVVTADRRRGLDHRLILHGRPRVLAVSQVLALDPVEPVVPVGRPRGALVVVRRRVSRALVIGHYRGQPTQRPPARTG